MNTRNIEGKLQESIDINEKIINERNKELKEITEGVEHIHELMKEVANIVHNQQPLVDNIESNVAATNQTTQKGLGEIRKANELHKKTRCNVM